MRPLEITVENFLPFEGKYSLDLSCIKAATICGPNEAGKSSFIIDPIQFALFGEARKKSDELIYSMAHEAAVILKASHLGKIYIIERGVKRDRGQSLKLLCDDKDISERLLTNTQKKLDNILGFSQTLLMSTAIAVQGEVNKLSLMGPTERERVLSEMLSLEQWEEKKKKVSKNLVKYEELLKSIESKTTEIAVINSVIEENQEKINGWQTSNKNQDDKILCLKQMLRELEEDANKYREFTAKKANLINITSQLNIYSDQLAALPLDDGIVDKIKEKKQQKEENINLYKDIVEGKIKLIEDIPNIQKKIDEVNKGINLLPQTKVLDDVPCVGMDIHDQCKLLVTALDAKKQASVISHKYNNNDLEQVKKTLSEEKLTREADIKYLDKCKTDLEQQNGSLQVEIIQLDNKLAQITEGAEIKRKYNDLLAQTKLLEEQIKIEHIEFNSDDYLETQKALEVAWKEDQGYKNTLTTLETTLKINKETRNRLETELSLLKESETKLANYKTLYNAYNDIPSLLFEQAIPAIEDHTNDILKNIYNGKRVQLRSFKETKSNTQTKALDIINVTPIGIRDFDSLCGSEQFRQSLALRIALALYNRELNNIDIDFMVIDEGFGSLDNSNINLVKMMLKDIANKFDLFLMITHVDELSDTFDHKIVINPAGKGERICLM